MRYCVELRRAPHAARAAFTICSHPHSGSNPYHNLLLSSKQSVHCLCSALRFQMAPTGQTRDKDKLARMEHAVRVLVQGLGEDLTREGLRDTPKVRREARVVMARRLTAVYERYGFKRDRLTRGYDRPAACGKGAAGLHARLPPGYLQVGSSTAVRVWVGLRKGRAQLQKCFCNAFYGN